jgi:hypothetical protein
VFWILERESLTFDVTFFFYFILLLLLSWFCWFLGLESVCFKFFLIFINFLRDVLCFLEIGRESLNFEIFFFLENNCQFVAYFDDIQNIVVILPFEFLKKIVIFILIIKKLFVFF